VLRDTNGPDVWNVKLRAQVLSFEDDEPIGLCHFDAETSGGGSIIPGYTFSGVFGLPEDVPLDDKRIRLIFFNNFGSVGVTLLNIIPVGLNQTTTLSAP